MARKRGEIRKGVKERGRGLRWGRRNEGGRHEVSERESSSSTHCPLQSPLVRQDCQRGRGEVVEE